MRLTAAAVLSLLLSSPTHAGPALGETWAQQTRVKTLIQTVRKQLSQRPAPAKKRSAGSKASTLDLGCGLFGVLCPQKLFRPMETGSKPINTGFKALGSADQTGEIDGPGRKGNGRYKTIKNQPYELILHIKTGYVDGTIGFKREKNTGKDVMSFSGRYWDQGKGKWGPQVDAKNDVVVTYDARRDKGKIRWLENGKWKQERYWGGKAGIEMTIELAGGWNHDFLQD